MMDRVLPLLNKLVPVGLAVKGLERINPKIKSFFGGAIAAGYSADQAMDFLRENLSGSQMNQPSAGSRPDEQAAFNRRQQEELPGRVAQGVGALGAGAIGGLGASALTSAGEAIGNAATPQQENQSQQPGGFLEFIKQNPELGSYLDSLMQTGMSPGQAATEARKKRKFLPIIEKIEKQIGQSFEDLLGQLFQGSERPSDQRSQGRTTNQASQGSDQSGGDSELISALQQILKM